MLVRSKDADIERADAEHAAELGLYEAKLLSDAGGLTQFGAATMTLEPGAKSSDRHWHENEDEFLYLLSGAATLIEDDGPHQMQPGDAAVWAKGVSNGHQIVNKSDKPCTFLIVGSRSDWDKVHYSEIDQIYARKNGQASRTKRDGTPL